MKEISIQELTRMVCDLPVNGNIYVKQHLDSELFGITCLNLFESDLIIISHFGGGFASLFDTSTTNEKKEMYSWLQYALGTDNSEKIVFVLTEEEVHGEQLPPKELWGVTFRVTQSDSTSYRTLAISECPIFNAREAAETWINEHKGMSYDSAFYAEDCSEPKAVLIDRWTSNSEDMPLETETMASLGTDFTDRIYSLRKDIITNITSILKENLLSEINFKGIITDMTDVLWCEGNGTWHDSPVTAVSLTAKGISLTVEDADEEICDTLDSENFDLAFTNPAWLASIRDNILEAIDTTKHLKNDTQLSLFKEWNIYVNDNEEEPHYANVSTRFKDDGSEGEVIISLIDHSEETADRVFHYARSLQELTELADTNPEATVQNFIILSLNSYSDTIENM